MTNLDNSTQSPQDETHTSTGGLIRLVIAGGQPLGAVVVHNPAPWMFRRTHLHPDDLEGFLWEPST